MPLRRCPVNSRVTFCIALPAMLLAACISSPLVRISDPRLLLTKTAVSDGRGNELFVQGYLLLPLESDSDLTKLAAENHAELSYMAETCDSHTKLDRWPYPYLSPEGKNNRSYVLLVAYRDKDRIRYDLAGRPESICVRVKLGSMNPWAHAESSEVRVSLPPSLQQSLRDYDRRSGAVELHLSPGCQAHMCIPRYGDSG
jgi:hypothetical protein